MVSTPISGRERLGLPPYPTGWYALCASTDLAPGAVVARTWFGRELVLWRTADGAAHLADAYCPHLGAHLGHGGRVEGDRLFCPFHAFAFDGGGHCVATPYGSLPKAARLTTWAVHEALGVVFAWFDGDGRPPRFDLPTLTLDGWAPFRLHTFAGIRSHPQETSENSVDIGHFQAVHRYTGVEQLAPPEVDGPVLRVRYAIIRSSLPGLSGAFRTQFRASLHGLGFSLVEAEVEQLGLSLRFLVLATPLDGERIDLHIGSSVHRGGFRGGAKVLQLLPAPVLDTVVHGAVMRAYVQDVSLDLAIWENKRYVHPPALARGDGPIGIYRAWTTQFYPVAGLGREASSQATG